MCCCIATKTSWVCFSVYSMLLWYLNWPIVCLYSVERQTVTSRSNMLHILLVLPRSVRNDGFIRHSVTSSWRVTSSHPPSRCCSGIRGSCGRVYSLSEICHTSRLYCIMGNPQSEWETQRASPPPSPLTGNITFATMKKSIYWLTVQENMEYIVY